MKRGGVRKVTGTFEAHVEIILCAPPWVLVRRKMGLLLLILRP